MLLVSRPLLWFLSPVLTSRPYLWSSFYNLQSCVATGFAHIDVSSEQFLELLGGRSVPTDAVLKLGPGDPLRFWSVLPHSTLDPPAGPTLPTSTWNLGTLGDTGASKHVQLAMCQLAPAP